MTYTNSKVLSIKEVFALAKLWVRSNGELLMVCYMMF